MQAIRLPALRHSLRPAFKVSTVPWQLSYRSFSSSTSRLSDDPSSSQTPTTSTPDSNSSEAKQKKADRKGETASKIETEVEVTLPLLQRPLGVRDRPTTEPRTWTDNMLNQEVRMEQRQKLVRAATKGYFSDLNATRKHGGKTWIAPRVLIREDKARYFPDISGTPLDSSEKAHTTSLCVGKVSVISMLSSRMSEIQTAMYGEPTHATYCSNPLYQHIRINLQENLLKSFLVSLFASNIRRNIPKEQWGKYLISSQNMDYLRDDLGMTNKHIGYVYLVDQACRIRWAACADPKPEEIEALKACTGVLLNRQKS
ncbi:unnamed protein product [Somion occarium]|uniref:Mitochondrial ATPase complex subunit ATP10 n=1 Tax=Somion occarium TaxID=3059160 RepID=A0ABP1CZ04_9APHY